MPGTKISASRVARRLRLSGRFQPRWLILGLLIPGMIHTQPMQPVDEYEVKAAFLYNFTKFVEWPATSSDSFYICILGDDPFGPNIDEFIKGKTANGKTLLVRRLKDAPDARQCQIAYVHSNDKNRAAQLIDAVRRMPVLTVGEEMDFGRMGGQVSLTVTNDRVGLHINAPAAEEAGLKVSAKLMRFAESFKDGVK